MDRAIEPPVKKEKKEGRRLFFPGETTWEEWSLQPGGASLRQKAFTLPEGDAMSRLRGGLAIPLQHAMVFPLWLATTDASLMRDMVSLQLERRGLAGPQESYAFDFRVLRQENDRSLLTVSFLPGGFSEALCFPRIQDYHLASDHWPLPSNHMLFWKELNTVILAFTSGQDLIYAQCARTANLVPSLIHEAHCARLALESENCLSALHGITVLGHFSTPEMESLRTLGLPLLQIDRPQPARPRNSRSLPPASIQTKRNQKQRARRNRKFLLTAIVLYFLFAGVFIGQFAWLSWKKKTIEHDLAATRPTIENIQNTARRWQALEPAILPEIYPLELLYRCAKLLPPEGVRLISYDQSGTRIVLSGESKNAPAAFQYAESLKKNPDLDAYVWTMPPPKLLPNDSAQFQLEGVRKDARAQTK